MRALSVNARACLFFPVLWTRCLQLLFFSFHNNAVYYSFAMTTRRTCAENLHVHIAQQEASLPHISCSADNSCSCYRDIRNTCVPNEKKTPYMPSLINRNGIVEVRGAVQLRRAHLCALLDRRLQSPAPPNLSVRYHQTLSSPSPRRLCLLYSHSLRCGSTFFYHLHHKHLSLLLIS